MPAASSHSEYPVPGPQLFKRLLWISAFAHVIVFALAQIRHTFSFHSDEWSVEAELVLDSSIGGAPLTTIPAPKTADEIIALLADQILRPIVLLLFALATILFLWGVIEFMINRDNEEERDKGKRHMIWGLAGLVIMVSALGIVNLLINFVKTF